MKCNKCGQENAAGSRFCCGCGNKLEKQCPGCQKPVPENARFCSFCGHNLLGENKAPSTMNDNVIAGDVDQSVHTHIAGNVDRSVHSQATNNVDTSVHYITIDRSMHSSVDQSVHSSVVNVYHGLPDTETAQEKELRQQLEAADYSFSTIFQDGKIVSKITKVSNLKSGNLRIPAQDWQGNPVVAIGKFAFELKSKLTSVIIPHGVTTIGGYAFNYCTQLTSVALPDSVTVIEGFAFTRCGIQSLIIPRSVQEIGDRAFYGSPITNLIFNGTLAEWRSIRVDGLALDGMWTREVHCTDGIFQAKKECPNCKETHHFWEWYCKKCHVQFSDPDARAFISRTTKK